MEEARNALLRQPDQHFSGLIRYLFKYHDYFSMIVKLYHKAQLQSMNIFPKQFAHSKLIVKHMMQYTKIN
jgi:hypothetical protein